jgi:hypothetical protein
MDEGELERHPESGCFTRGRSADNGSNGETSSQCNFNILPTQSRTRDKRFEIYVQR